MTNQVDVPLYILCDIASVMFCLFVLPNFLLLNDETTNDLMGINDPNNNNNNNNNRDFLLYKKPEMFLKVGIPLLIFIRTGFLVLICPQAIIHPSSMMLQLKLTLFHVIKETIVFHILIVLFGAPCFELVERTLWISVLLGVLRSQGNTIAESKDQHWKETISKYQGIGAILGAWLGAIPIPLDWDRPWQTWPVTLIYGAVFGYCIGCITGAVMYKKQSQHRKSL